MPDPCVLGTKTFLMAVDIYRANGGKVTCSPNQSCEGETPDSVILKNYEGHPVAEVVLSTKVVRSPSVQTHSPVHGDQGQPVPAKSVAGPFCSFVAVLTLVGGVLAAISSYDPVVRSFGLGAAASSGPLFALGSIASSTRHSAISAQRMAQLMAEQENRRRAAKPDA